MTLPKSRDDREFESYRDTPRGFAKSVVNVSEVIWNKIETTFPTSTQDLYSYFYDTTLVMTILVTYANTSKKDIVTVLKTRFD
jgi:hypothetical protein